MSAFEQLGVEAWLARQCTYMALHSPTPIQRACIPAILAGRHVVGGAATGSGKTAAFALPILQTLSADVYGVFALVLTPSRELAYQIADQFIALGAPLRARTMLAIGGVRHEEQVDALKSRPPIAIATPGRLLHLLTTFRQEVAPAFAHLRFLVLDEADRLTEGEMSQTVRELLRVLAPHPRRQVLLFTATLEARLTTPPAVDTAGEGREGAEAAEVPWLGLLGVGAAPATGGTENTTGGLVVCDLSQRVEAGAGPSGEAAVSVSVTGTQSPSPSPSTVVFPETLRQCYVFIPDMVKLPNLVAALRALGKDQSTIVFANSCLRAELVRLTLQLLGFPVCSLDSLLTQQHRLDNLALFKLGIAKILVATDIAARGLDIPTVGSVIHYDVPKHATTYVHRVGRTARAGREGLSIALVTEHDVELVQRVERRLGVTLAKWKQPALREEKILKILDEVSAAKVQAKQQVTEQFGNRAATLKEQAAARKHERRVTHEAHRTSKRPRAQEAGRAGEEGVVTHVPDPVVERARTGSTRKVSRESGERLKARATPQAQGTKAKRRRTV